RALAGRALPGSEQGLDRPQVGLLADRFRLSGARLRRRGQAEQDLPPLARVLIAPEGLVAGHGLPPVGHGEVAVDRLGLAESLHGVLVLEVVEGGHAAQEGRLRRGRAGVGEANGRQADEGDERERDQRTGFVASNRICFSSSGWRASSVLPAGNLLALNT